MEEVNEMARTTHGRKAGPLEEYCMSAEGKALADSI
jgi:hypothetical protein